MSAQYANETGEERSEPTQLANSDTPVRPADPMKVKSMLLKGQKARFWVVVLVVFLSILAMFLHALPKSNQSAVSLASHTPDSEVGLVHTV